MLWNHLYLLRSDTTNQNNSVLHPFCICFPQRKLYKVKSKHSSALRNVIFHQRTSLALECKDLGLDKNPPEFDQNGCACISKLNRPEIIAGHATVRLVKLLEQSLAQFYPT